MQALKTISIIAFVLVCCIAILGFQQNTEQIPDKAQRLEALRSFNQKYQNQFTIRLHGKSGTPATIRGTKITKYRGSPEEIAQAFFNEEKTMLGIQNVTDDLELITTNYMPITGTSLKYRQRYKGVQILGSGYLVSVGNDGAIHYVSGDYFPEIDINTETSINVSTVRNIIEADLVGRNASFIILPQIYINVNDRGTDEESFQLVYQAVLNVSSPFDEMAYLVDAMSGDIIAKRSVIDRGNGSGDVFDTNPFHGGYVTRTLYGLNDPVSGYYYLNGENVDVLNDDTYPTRACSTTAQFYYDTTDTRFDEVMAYYHSDEFERHLINLGLEQSKVEKITINTHCDSINYAGSYKYQPKILFTDGRPDLGLRNPTHESSVIVHEYMHQVTRSFGKLNDTPTVDDQEDAMNEAFSDYYGVAYISDLLDSIYSTMGEYIDVPGGYVWRRELQNSWTFDYYGTLDLDLEPNGVNEMHDNSVIYSGALWDFRWDEDTDREAADELILNSLSEMDDYATFLDGMDALIDAAELQYSSYIDDIVYAFYEHGIGDPPSDPPTVSISGVTSMYTDQSKQWTAGIEDGESPFTYQWKRKDFGEGSWTNVGTSSTYTYSYPDTSFYLLVDIEDDYGRTDSDTITVTVSVRPLDVDIDGWHIPYAYYEGDNSWWAEVSGGTPPYNTYAWSMKVRDIEKEDDWSDWESVCSDSIYDLESHDWEDLEVLFEAYGFGIGSYFKLKVVVTDNAQSTDDKIVDLEVTEAPKKISAKPLPKDFKLEQNYPNPFNPVTTISFQLPKASNVTLVIYNIQGREVARLVDGYVGAGYHSASWDASTAASGIYIYRLQAGEFSDTKRMLLIK